MDTCGLAPWDDIKEVLPSVDLILFDIKIMDAEQHRELTGMDNRLILENLGRLADEEVILWIRIPIIPGCNDTEENMRKNRRVEIYILED